MRDALVAPLTQCSTSALSPQPPCCIEIHPSTDLVTDFRTRCFSTHDQEVGAGPALGGCAEGAGGHPVEGGGEHHCGLCACVCVCVARWLCELVVGVM